MKTTMNLKSYSQIGQDIFVNNLLKEKRNGLFLDIGCHKPIHINNTYLFESEYDWDGISIDIDNFSEEWKTHRKTKFIMEDALTIDYNALIQELLTKHSASRIDYLSVDLEPPQVTLDVLHKIPFSNYRFSVITFEHDHYRNKTVIQESRKIFEQHNYKLLIADINRQEDWWIDNTFDVEWGQVFSGKTYQ